MLLYVIIYLYGKVSNKVIMLQKPSTDIQKILYQKKINKTLQDILQLHNSCYMHFVLLQV